jgi:hypothetical protein
MPNVIESLLHVLAYGFGMIRLAEDGEGKENASSASFQTLACAAEIGAERLKIITMEREGCTEQGDQIRDAANEQRD